MLEGGKGFICSVIVADDEEGAHEEAGVGLLLEVGGAVVEDLDASVLVVLHYALQLCAEAVDLSQTQWAEVLVVPLVH